MRRARTLSVCAVRLMQSRSFVKESLEYVNKANAAHKEQVPSPPHVTSPARCAFDAGEQMDRDLERAKAGLDLIESQTQLANDARMIRIKKAVKSGNLCAPSQRSAFLPIASHHALQRRNRQVDGRSFAGESAGLGGLAAGACV